MLKYIIGIVVIIAIWVAWFFLLFPDLVVIPIAVTLLVIAVWVAIFVVRRMRARRAAKELEKALAAQAQEHARMARPDQLAEIQAMRAEFDRAVESLKTSKLGQGQDAMYALPWHVIIGPPGAGKSTALRNSGLQFPYLSASGGGVRGVGGTRNCDWWMTNEAIILDTAGRWATEDEDRDEWHTFLEMLRKTRPERPLNGIICAVALSDLGSATEDEVHALGNQMRSRIDEVMDRLQMSLPVYVLFTKADLIPGFVDLFGDMSKEDRGQIWGFTAPVSQSIGEPGNYFGQRFDELVEAVEKKSILRLGEERKLDARERIFAFPQQMAVLRKNLGDFVSTVFTENAFKESPKFRGAYFTSGTQEGRPIDLVMNRMAEAFGVRSALPTREVTDSKSYFLRDVFKKVVFLDSDLAMWSAGEQAARRRAHLGAAIALFGLAALISILPAYAAYRNHQKISRTEAVVEAAEDAGEGDGPVGPEPLDGVRAELERLREGAPVSETLGMDQSEEVREELEKFFAQMFQEQVLRPIYDQDVRDLTEFGRQYEDGSRQPPASEYSRFYGVLKTHLLLTAPKAEGEPGGTGAGMTHAHADWLEQYLVQKWAERLELDFDDDDDAERAEQMRQIAHLYIKILNENTDDFSLPRDEEAVTKARNAINLVPSENLAIESLIGEYENRGFDLTLESMIGTAVHQVHSDKIVRGAFTRRAWEQGPFPGAPSIKERLAIANTDRQDDGLPGGEGWVLGIRLSPEEQAQQADERQERLARLRSSYFRAYIEEWQEFIEAIVVDPPNRDNGNQEALMLLQDLNRGTPKPYGLLFRAIHYNTHLEEEEEEGGAAQEAAEDSAAREIRNRFRRTNPGRIIMEFFGGPSAEDGSTDSAGQIVIDHQHVAVFFEGFANFGVSEPVAEGETPPPTSLDSYLEQLQLARDAMRTQVDTPNPENDAALLSALQTARTLTDRLINEQPVGWRPLFESILWPPIDGASMSSTRAMAHGAGRSWCAEVFSPFHHNLEGRYPFDRAGLDVPLADFTAFFARGEEGTLWGFYDQVLDPAVERDGDQFDFKTQFSRNGDFQPSLLQFLEAAHGLTSGFFPPGSAEPKIEFDIRIRPSPTVAIQYFRIGGTEVEYHNGPEQWVRVAWPGESPEAGAEVEVRGTEGINEKVSEAGEWGLFRLLEEAEVTDGGGTSVFRMTWRLRTYGVDVTVDIRPVRGETPFFGLRGRTQEPVLLYPIRTPYVAVPREIVSSARICNVR